MTMIFNDAMSACAARKLAPSALGVQYSNGLVTRGHRGTGGH